MVKWDNLTNKISLRIKNSRQASLKAHFKAVPKELRNRKQIEIQIRNQCNILEKKTLVNLIGSMRDHLTFAIIPKSDVLLALHGVKAGEPP